MKIEIGKERPEYFKEAYPRELDGASHFGCAAVIPEVLSLITTFKENRKPNATFYAGTSFAGDSNGHFVIIPYPETGGGHIYTNIIRDGGFCVNYLSSKYYGACIKTIENNGDEDDEVAAGGFTSELCTTVKAPRITESIISLECVFKSTYKLPGHSRALLLIGEVQYAHIEAGYHIRDKICSPDGFMYNINSAQDLSGGERTPWGAAYLTPFEI